MSNPDGAEDDDSGESDQAEEEASNVTVTDAGEAEPAQPKWEKPDVDDIPEFETGGGPAMGAGTASGSEPAAGKPNDARAPGSTRVDEHATEAYVAAMELCARLPDDLSLPDEAADLVPVAFEAELERNIQAFAAAEFDNPMPHVEELSFFEADDDVWLKLRLGAPVETFEALSDRTDELREYALQELDSLF